MLLSSIAIFYPRKRFNRILYATYITFISLLEEKVCGRDDCHRFATCADTGPGEYKCTCNKGYTGDGKTCTGLQIYSFYAIESFFRTLHECSVYY